MGFNRSREIWVIIKWTKDQTLRETWNYTILETRDHKNTFIFKKHKKANLFQVNNRNSRVKSGNFGHQVNSDIHLQTVEIQMRRLFICLVIFYSNN